MTTLPRLRGPLAVGLIALASMACGDPDAAETGSSGGGDGEGGGNTSSAASSPTAATSSSGQTGGAGPAGSGSSSSAGGAGGASSASSSSSSTASGGGEPCIPPFPHSLDAPTPGRCEDGAAIVCDVESATLVTTRCGEGETCTTFDVVDHVFDFDRYVENQTYVWAACIPDDAVACEMEFQTYRWGAESVLAACDGSDRTACLMPPIPDYGLNGPPVGTTLGYIQAIPCGDGEVCREPLAGATTDPASLGCFASDAPVCDGFFEACDGDQRVICDTGFGFLITQGCGANTCMMGCNGVSYCVLEGTEVCDPEAPRTCDDQNVFQSCSLNCLSNEIDCDEYSFDPQTGMYIPADCVQSDSGPTCLPEGQEPCDSNAPETCANDVAQRCENGLPREYDCGEAGQDCLVGANGHAGCAPAGAQACEPTPGPGDYECNGDILEGCCPAGGSIYSLAGALPCAPGFEAAVDCSDLFFPLICVTENGFSSCSDP